MNGDFMLISLIRAAILYVIVIAAMRILGKRQIGELQPAELVVTILLSEILVIPMQDNDVPLLNTIVPVLLIIGFEILVSVISLKSVKFRSLLQGNSLIVIRNGVLDQQQLKRLRFTTDDLLEALRKKDVFDISTVQYAVVETDGSMSVLLKSDYETVENKDLDIKTDESVFNSVVICDGKIIQSDFKECGMSYPELQKYLKKKHINPKQVMLMTMDKNGRTVIIDKDDKK